MDAQTSTIKHSNQLVSPSQLTFDLQIPNALRPVVRRKLENGFRDDATGALWELMTAAEEKQAMPVFNASKKALNFFSSESSISLDNVHRFVRESLYPVAEVLSFERIQSIDQKAEKVIKAVDKPFPNKDEITIGWRIFKDCDSQFLMPLDTFFHRFRTSLENQAIRDEMAFSHQQKKTGVAEFQKTLLETLKRLFRYRGKLVEEWRDVESNLRSDANAARHALKIAAAKKWFVLEFKEAKAERMLTWIDDVHLLAAQNGFHFTKVAVLADYRSIRTPFRPAWRGRFGDAGALFEKFPDGVNTFLEAIKIYDEELTAADKMYKEKREARKKQSAAVA